MLLAYILPYTFLRNTQLLSSLERCIQLGDLSIGLAAVAGLLINLWEVEA